jgi:hypothetical protein
MPYRILNSCVYGQLFEEATEAEWDSLRTLGHRWKQYEKEGKWRYEAHPFWCTGYTFWDLHSEAPDLFQHLSESDLVIFKGDLNHRKLAEPMWTVQADEQENSLTIVTHPSTLHSLPPSDPLLPSQELLESPPSVPSSRMLLSVSHPESERSSMRRSQDGRSLVNT